MSDGYSVYMYVNVKNDKRYIGVTKFTMQARAGKDGVNYRGSPSFYNAIRKYGWTSFEGSLMASGLTKQAAADLEKELIDKYETRKHEKGYSLHRGGFETRDYSAETKMERVERIKATLKQQRSSPEIRKKMSERMLKQWADPAKSEHRLKMHKIRKPSKRSRTIFCKETNEIFYMAKDAALRFGFSSALLCAWWKNHDTPKIVHTKDPNYPVVTLSIVPN